MSPMEITLLVIGVIIFVLSFIIKDKTSEVNEYDESVMAEEVRRLLDKEIDSIKLKVNEATDSTIEYAMEKSERSLAKISNEKIMAIDEYSVTVMDEINRNHKEVMFLYDMLNDKQAEIKNTVRKVEATRRDIEESIPDSYELAENYSDEQAVEEYEVSAEAYDYEYRDDGKENNNQKIIELHKLGRSKVEIARELNLGVGEVTLVIDLFER